MPPHSHPTQLKAHATGSNEQCAWADIVVVGSELFVTPELAEYLLEQHPSLAQHACKSGGERSKSTAVQRGMLSNESNQRTTPPTTTFGERIVGALLPHAVEHLAIELLVERFPGETFAGNTCWLEREEQSMRVRVSAAKSSAPQDTLTALLDALGLLNGFLAICQGQMGQKPLS